MKHLKLSVRDQFEKFEILISSLKKRNKLINYYRRNRDRMHHGYIEKELAQSGI